MRPARGRPTAEDATKTDADEDVDDDGDANDNDDDDEASFEAGRSVAMMASMLAVLDLAFMCITPRDRLDAAAPGRASCGEEDAVAGVGSVVAWASGAVAVAAAGSSHRRLPRSRSRSQSPATCGDRRWATGTVGSRVVAVAGGGGGGRG